MRVSFAEKDLKMQRQYKVIVSGKMKLLQKKIAEVTYPPQIANSAKTAAEKKQGGSGYLEIV